MHSNSQFRSLCCSLWFVFFSAALTAHEPELAIKDAITPRYEHQYVEGRDWLSRHFLVRAPRGSIAVEPLYEVADETYSVYFEKPL